MEDAPEEETPDYESDPISESASDELWSKHVRKRKLHWMRHVRYRHRCWLPTRRHPQSSFRFDRWVSAPHLRQLAMICYGPKLDTAMRERRFLMEHGRMSDLKRMW